MGHFLNNGEMLLLKNKIYQSELCCRMFWFFSELSKLIDAVILDINLHKIIVSHRKCNFLGGCPKHLPVWITLEEPELRPFVQCKCASWLVCLACFFLCLNKKRISSHASHLLAIDEDASCLY